MEKNSDSFVRNRFEDGMLLSAADLTDLQEYYDGKRRLGYRGFFGYGIVYGLTVDKVRDGVAVNPGLAIDRQGREIYLPETEQVSSGSLLRDAPVGVELFLCVEYAEEPCGEALVISGGNLRETVYGRVREKYRFVVKNSLEDRDICLAVIAFSTRADVLQISSATSAQNCFRFARIWRGLLPRHSYGSIYIGEDDLPDENGVFFSKEIDHGLGCGRNVGVELSVGSFDGTRPCKISGDAQLFGLAIRVAVKLFPESGTFTVAVKPRSTMDFPVCVRWHAYTEQEDDIYE